MMTVLVTNRRVIRYKHPDSHRKIMFRFVEPTAYCRFWAVIVGLRQLHESNLAFQRKSCDMITMGTLIETWTMA